MTTYPPPPDPPEPDRPGDPPEGGWGPASESAPGDPPGEAPAGDPPGETPAGDPPSWNAEDLSTNPSNNPLNDPPGWTPGGAPHGPPSDDPAPPVPPPMPVGGGFDPYTGGAVPPPPPPPPPYNSDGPVQREGPRNGLGTAALVCGILAVALSFIPGVNWFTWPLGVLAIVFGAIGWSRANKGQATNKGYAIAGLVLGILSFFTFCLAYWVLFGATATSINYNAAPFL